MLRWIRTGSIWPGSSSSGAAAASAPSWNTTAASRPRFPLAARECVFVECRTASSSCSQSFEFEHLSWRQSSLKYGTLISTRHHTYCLVSLATLCRSMCCDTNLCQRFIPGGFIPKGNRPNTSKAMMTVGPAPAATIFHRSEDAAAEAIRH
jgi:hypothetical protein